MLAVVEEEEETSVVVACEVANDDEIGLVVLVVVKDFSIKLLEL